MQVRYQMQAIFVRRLRRSSGGESAQSAEGTLTAFSQNSPLARGICLRWNFRRMKQNPNLLCILLAPRAFSPDEIAGADSAIAAHEIHRA